MSYARQLFFVTAIILFAAYLVETAASFKDANARFQDRQVPGSVLGITRLRERMMHMGILAVTPNSKATYEQLTSPHPDPDGLPNLRKGHGAHAYTLSKNVDPNQFPSTTLLPVEEISNLPTLSVALDEFDYRTGRKALLKNLGKRGRRWERGGFISYLENGKVVFSSAVGLRIHGGKSRFYLKEKNFRIVLRDIYGKTQIPPGLIFPTEQGPSSQFIAQADLRRSHSRAGTSRLINPLAYDIVRHIGGKSARTKPVQYFLNGHYQGIYVLTEHLNEEYFQKYFGHDNFTFFRERVEDADRDGFEYGDRAEFDALRGWSFTREQDWSLAAVDKVIDLRNFSLSMIALLFCGTTDSYQAVVAKSNIGPDTRWNWVNWDMDHSFLDVYRSEKYPWQHRTLGQLLSGNSAERSRVSFQIFKGLINRNAQYRFYFMELLQTTLNHRLTPEYLDERLDHYEHIADTYGSTRRKYRMAIREFLEKRHPAVFEQVVRRFAKQTAGIFAVKVRVKPGQQLFIDDVLWEKPYHGTYFQGLKVRVRSENAGAKFFVNGVKAEARGALEVVVNGALDIRVE